MVFFLDGLLSALPDPSAGATSLSDSTECSYYSCDHSADYVGSASNGADNKLTTDGVIYPKYAAFAEAQTGNSPTQLWGLEIDHTGDYVGTPPNPLTGDGTIYPAYDPSYAAAGNSTFQLSDSTECSYYSCDHSSDYVGSASNGADNKLTTDGVIYPKYTAFAEAQTGSPTTQLWGLDTDHTGDYIGSDGSLLGDGVIYPAQEGAAPFTTTQLGFLDSTPSGSNVTADHSGAYYCGEPEAKCSIEIVDPDLVNCPHCQLAPVVAAPVPVKKGDKEDPVRPGPGHLMLMGHALIFGAAGATVKLFSSEQSEGSWIADFKADSCAAAEAVTPVGGCILKKSMAQEA